MKTRDRVINEGNVSQKRVTSHFPVSLSPCLVWWRAVRPKSFTATTTPILVGVALAGLHGSFDLGWAVLTLLAAVLLQAGTNLVNDYFDYRNGVDSSASLSPSGVIQQEVLSPTAVLRGGLVCFGVAAVLGVVLALHGGPLIWGLGVLGVLIGVLYTAGPFPLAYLGLGEVVVFVAMGPAMVLGAYVEQTRSFAWVALAAGVPVGLLVAALLHANNLRDIETDRAQGKRTLAARFGRAIARREYTLLMVGAYVTLFVPAFFDLRLLFPTLPPLLTLPAALRLIREANSTEEPMRLHAVLRGTGVLHGRFGLLWGGSIAVLALVGVLFAPLIDRIMR